MVLVLGGAVVEDHSKSRVLLHLLLYSIAVLANQACVVIPVNYYWTAPQRAQKVELKEG
jgi:hypothetical protein